MYRLSFFCHISQTFLLFRHRQIGTASLNRISSAYHSDDRSRGRVHNPAFYALLRQRKLDDAYKMAVDPQWKADENAYCNLMVELSRQRNLEKTATLFHKLTVEGGTNPYVPQPTIHSFNVMMRSYFDHRYPMEAVRLVFPNLYGKISSELVKYVSGSRVSWRSQSEGSVPNEWITPNVISYMILLEHLGRKLPAWVTLDIVQDAIKRNDGGLFTPHWINVILNQWKIKWKDEDATFLRKSEKMFIDIMKKLDIIELLLKGDLVNAIRAEIVRENFKKSSVPSSINNLEIAESMKLHRSNSDSNITDKIEEDGGTKTNTQDDSKTIFIKPNEVTYNNILATLSSVMEAMCREIRRGLESNPTKPRNRTSHDMARNTEAIDRRFGSLEVLSASQLQKNSELLINRITNIFDTVTQRYTWENAAYNTPDLGNTDKHHRDSLAESVDSVREGGDRIGNGSDTNPRTAESEFVRPDGTTKVPVVRIVVMQDIINFTSNKISSKWPQTEEEAFSKASKLLQRLQDKYHTVIDLPFFNIWMDSISKRGFVSNHEVNSILKLMKSFNIEGDMVTFTSAIQGLGESRNADSIYVIWNHVMKSGMVVDDRFGGVLIDACIKCNRLGLAHLVWKQFKQKTSLESASPIIIINAIELFSKTAIAEAKRSKFKQPDDQEKYEELWFEQPKSTATLRTPGFKYFREAWYLFAVLFKRKYKYFDSNKKFYKIGWTIMERNVATYLQVVEQHAPLAAWNDKIRSAPLFIDPSFPKWLTQNFKNVPLLEEVTGLF